MDRPALLFDMYGVLMRLPGPGHRSGILRATGLDARIWPAYEELRPRLDAGQITEASYWKEIARQAHQPAPDLADAVDADYSECVRADIPVVENVLRLIDAGYTAGVLSNIPSELALRVRLAHAEWLDAFHAVTFSCDIGVAKPEPEAYRVALDAMEVAPRDAIFFDDREDYLAGARRVGIPAVRFTGWESVERALEQA